MKVDNVITMACAFQYNPSFGTCTITETIGGNSKTTSYSSDEAGVMFHETETFYYGNFGDVRTLKIEDENGNSSTITLNGYDYIYLGLSTLDETEDVSLRNILITLYNFVESLSEL